MAVGVVIPELNKKLTGMSYCVPTDFRGEPCTSVFDAEAGISLDGTFVTVVGWYDNEWGCSNKCLEMARVVAA